MHLFQVESEIFYIFRVAILLLCDISMMQPNITLYLAIRWNACSSFWQQKIEIELFLCFVSFPLLLGKLEYLFPLPLLAYCRLKWNLRRDSCLKVRTMKINSAILLLNTSVYFSGLWEVSFDILSLRHLTPWRITVSKKSATTQGEWRNNK